MVPDLVHAGVAAEDFHLQPDGEALEEGGFLTYFTNYVVY